MSCSLDELLFVGVEESHSSKTINTGLIIVMTMALLWCLAALPLIGVLFLTP